MEKWFVETKRADFNALSAKFNISPITARLLRNRDMETNEEIGMFLNGKREDLFDPFLFKDMEKGTSLMKDAIKSGKKIRIIGDYDVDGICSSYILDKGIRYAGGDCDVRIPHRIDDGYGLNERLIDEAIEDQTDLVITCDNGIAAFGPVEKAKKSGMTVIVTDHHEVPFDEEGGVRKYRIPDADAVIDQKQKECTYPFKEVCGGVVAYKFIKALLSYDEMPDMTKELDDELLSFAAFATIEDVMPLVGENHLIVKYGLPLIENTGNIGLKALIEQCELSDKTLTPYHIGFIIGPCLNASGRLDTALRGIELLTCRERAEAVKMAVELREMNRVRQDLTEEGFKKAIDIVENDPAYKEEKVICVFLPDMHESLAGIIAGRLRERYKKPSFVLTKAENGTKGSGRSIEAYNMFEEMTKIKDIFVKFGGHTGAAGLSIKSGDEEEFRKRINESCSLKDEDLIEKVMIDIPMPVRCVSDALIEELKVLEPFGTGNPTPLFAEKNVTFTNLKIFGAKRNVLKGVVTGEGGAKFDAIAFGAADEMYSEIESHGGKLSIAYSVGKNTFRGRTTTELTIKHMMFEEQEV